MLRLGLEFLQSTCADLVPCKSFGLVQMLLNDMQPCSWLCSLLTNPCYLCLLLPRHAIVFGITSHMKLITGHPNLPREPHSLMLCLRAVGSWWRRRRVQ